MAVSANRFRVYNVLVVVVAIWHDLVPTTTVRLCSVHCALLSFDVPAINSVCGIRKTATPGMPHQVEKKYDVANIHIHTKKKKKQKESKYCNRQHQSSVRIRE